ncbi:MAG: hypothetical protein JWN48_836 [Myxococcaceae bacterium]|nr:hypothetical protein [Myxococcaceae bacterium]
MCVDLRYRTLLPLLFVNLLLWSHLAVSAAQAQLLDGIERWADSTVGLSSSKWAGARVPFPPPSLRPQTTQRLDSLDWPLSVHAGPQVPVARLVQVLLAAEATHALLAATGFLTSFGDAGQAGTGGRDLYLVDGALPAAHSAIDASGNFSALDGARAFALLDARLPAARLFACTAQALVDAQLFELDPAEASALRRASAAYFAALIAGETCDDPALEPSQNPFLADSSASGAAWLAALAERQDQNRGTFLFDMWQFARQRTWEGEDLRASPDLMEAIDKALERSRESLALVAGELSESLALAHPELVRTLPWAALPSFTPRSDPPLGIFGSKHLRIELGGARPGTRLRVWSRGEAGGRYTLSAQRFDAEGKQLARLELEPRRDPTSQLSIELDARTNAVLVSVTRFADEGVPDPDRFWPEDVRPVSITVDSQQ